MARLLRKLGAEDESRQLAEEAYQQGKAPLEKRQEAALLRAITNKNLDDQITWLERSNPTSGQAKASLAEAHGKKALREGKDEEATGFFRQALAVYGKEPESAATLNNAALANQLLFHASGERAALDRSLQLMEKALTYQPGNAILLGNIADIVLGTAVRRPHRPTDRFPDPEAGGFPGPPGLPLPRSSGTTISY